jgi:hypothetical protein
MPILGPPPKRSPLAGVTGAYRPPAPPRSPAGVRGAYQPPPSPVGVRGAYRPITPPSHPYAYGVSAPSVRPPPRPARAENLRAFPKPQNFAAIGREAAQLVQHAQLGLPKVPTPYIPRLPSYSPAGLAEALRLTKSSLGGTTPQQQREILNDPRQAAFIQTLAHVLRQSRAETRAIAQRPVPWTGGSLIGEALANAPMSPREELASFQQQQRNWQQEGRQMLLNEARQRVAHEGDVGLPLIGTINPMHLMQAMSSAHLPGIAGEALSAIGGFAASRLGLPASMGSKAASEAIDFPGQTLLSAYLGGSALKEGTKGNWQPTRQMGEGALTGLTHPWRTPLSSALMISGLESGVFGLLGRAGRLGIAGSKVADYLNAVKPDIALYGEGQLVPKAEGEGFTMGQLAPKEGLRISNRGKYNVDPLRGLIERGLERRTYGEPMPLRPGEAPAYQATGAQLKRLTSGGPFKVGSVDVAAAAGERQRVGMVRGAVNRVMDKLAEKGGEVRGTRPRNVNAREAVQEVAENLIHPDSWTADFEAELARAKRELVAKDSHGNALLTAPERAANKANIKRIEAILSDSKLAKEVAEKRWQSEPFQAAERVKEQKRPLEASAMYGGVLQPRQARSSLFSYAINKMGAKYHRIEDHVAAEDREVARGASQDRIDEVSGRDPTGVRAHRAAQESLDQAQQSVFDRANELSRVERDRNKVLGKQQERRQAEGTVAKSGMRLQRKATEAEQQTLAGWDKRLNDAALAHREAKVAVREADGQVKDTPLPQRNPGLRGQHGEYLSDQTILDHMAERGHTPPTYFLHVRGGAGRQSFYKAVSRQPALHVYPRTGEAHVKVINDRSWANVVGTVAHQASEDAQLEVRRGFLNRFAMDRFRNVKGVHRAAENFEGDPANKGHVEALGRVIPVHYGSGDIVSSEGFKNAVDPVELESTIKQMGLEPHRPIAHDELGHFGAIPEHVYSRYKAHEEAVGAKPGEQGNITRAWQAYAKAWRRAKLNTSMPHIFGVMQEQLIRLLAEQAGPMAWAAGRKYDRKALKPLAEVDSHGYMAERAGPLGEKYRYQEAAIGARGGLGGSARWTDITRKGEQMQLDGTRARLLRAGERTLNSPAGKAIHATWRGWYKLIEDGLERVTQEAAYHAHLGKALRESGVIDSYRSVLKMQDDAVKKLIEDRLTPNAADAVARRVMDMYGNWTAQTPFVKGFVSRYAPFGLWYLNSLRWLYRLPLTHPVKAGVLAALYRGTAKERAEMGQGIETAAAGKKPVPGFLQGTIPIEAPLVGKVKAVPGYYSPWGALGQEWGQTAAEQLVPFLSSTVAALQGVNPLTHEKLTGPEKEQVEGNATLLNALAEASAGPMPLSTQLQTLAQMGGKPYGTANWITDLAHVLGLGPGQVKPGTQHKIGEVLGKMFFPTRIIRPKATKGKSATEEAEERAFTKAGYGGGLAPSKKGQEAEERAFAHAGYGGK